MLNGFNSWLGCCGATAARELAFRGFDVTVIERGPCIEDRRLQVLR